jgi:chorismate mutase
MRPSVTEAQQLDELRKAIDKLDSDILGLVAQRIELVLQIAEYKRTRELPVYDPERERNVIERLIGLAPSHLDAGLVRRIFERIIDESRRIEQHRAP